MKDKSQFTLLLAAVPEVQGYCFLVTDTFSSEGELQHHKQQQTLVKHD